MLVETWINWLATSFPPSASNGSRVRYGSRFLRFESAQRPRSIYLSTVLRSMPVCLAIADADRPRRCKSRIMIVSLSLITEIPLPTIGRSIDDDAPPVFRGAPRETGGTPSPILLSMVERGLAVIKLGEIVMILDLHRQGLSVSAIARQTGVDRKTIRKYIERGLEAPAYGPR